MSKKKKYQTDLERKITNIFLRNPNKELNHKQVSAALKVNDTKGRNEIIKMISKVPIMECVVAFCTEIPLISDIKNR